jgi:hypothetical protein
MLKTNNQKDLTLIIVMSYKSYEHESSELLLEFKEVFCM